MSAAWNIVCPNLLCKLGFTEPSKPLREPTDTPEGHRLPSRHASIWRTSLAGKKVVRPAFLPAHLVGKQVQQPGSGQMAQQR